MIDFLKIVFLFLIVWQSPIIIVRACHNLDIKAASFLWLAAGITGFVYLQWLM